MNFLNLSPAEFFVLLGTASAFITALYLLDRNKKRRVVSTLRFWAASTEAEEQKNRKRVREPWSLLLQLVALLCLCLAIAQIHWGGAQRPVRNHVLLIDTSSASVLTDEKTLARQYVQRLPATDRVMLVEVDGLVTPITSFTSDRTQLEQSIRQATASHSALNLQHALQFARQALLWPTGEAGELVYDGPGRVAQPVHEDVHPLRLLTVQSKAPSIHIVNLDARPGLNAHEWTATVSIRNDDDQARDTSLFVQFGSSTFTARRLRLRAGEEREAEYTFVTTSGGELRAAVQPGDGAEASIRLPANRALHIAVFTSRPEVLRPLLGANRRWTVQYFPPSQYAGSVSADLIVLDQFAPATPPAHATLYVHPPRQNSPLPLRATVRNQLVNEWNVEGLHAADLRLPESNVYETFKGDLAMASVANGPVVVARTEPDGTRRAVIGFDPVAPSLRYQVTSPLLVAHLLRWLGPEAFDVPSVSCRPVGLVTLPIEQSEQESVHVTTDAGTALPFTVRDARVQFYVQNPVTVRVVSAQREQTLWLTLPQVAAYTWKPGGAAEGLPPRAKAIASELPLWRVLAIIGGALLLTEWIIFAQHAGKTRVALKVAGLAAVLAALVVPSIRMPAAKTGTIVLVDTSASIGSDAVSRAATVVKQLVRERGRNWLSVVPFDARPRPAEAAAVTVGGVFVPVANKTDTSATDLEAALTESVAAVPEGYVPRLLLLSDGNENQGSTARAIAELRHMHVPVDTIPLSGRSLTNVTISSVAMPAEAYAGEQIPISVTVEAPAAGPASLSLQAEGKVLGTQSITLQKGTNVVRAQARLKTNGTAIISGTLSAGDSGSVHFDQPVSLKRARVLYLSQDVAGTGENFISLLRSDQFTVDTDPGLLHDRDARFAVAGA